MTRNLPGIKPAPPAATPDPLAGLDKLGLSADTHRVALASALLWTWRTRTDLLGLLPKMEMKTREGRNFTAEGVKLALNELAKARLLVELASRPGYFHLADTLRVPLYRQLLTLRDGREWAHLIAQFDKLSVHHGWWYFSASQVPGMTALVRAHLLAGAPATEIEPLRIMVSHGHDWNQILNDAVLRPFDPETFDRIAADIRWPLVESALLGIAVLWSEAYRPIADWTKQQLRTHPREVPAPVRWALADIALQSADSELFERSVDGLDDANSAALRAAARILAGDWAAGQAAFELASKRMQQETGARKRLFASSLTWLYPLSLLAQGTPKQLEIARKFCVGESGTRAPSAYDAWGAWVNAIDAKLGNAPLETKAFLQPASLHERYSWRELWRILLAAWLGPEQFGDTLRKKGGRNDSPLIDGLRKRLQALGLHALRQQLDGAAAVLAGGEPPAGFFVGRRQEAWREVLAALQSLASPAAAREGKSEATTRLLWEIFLGKDGALKDIRPLEQKRGARGWNLPKPLTLSRLAAMKELPAHDARVAGALRPERHHAGRFNLDLAAAIAALAGHPAVFLAGRPETLVDLVESAPEMEIVRKGGQIAMRVSPPPRSEPDGAWYSNAEERRDAEALRLITLLADGPQRLRLIRYNAAQRRAAQLVSGRFALPADDPAAKAELEKTLQALSAHFQLHADAAQAARQVAPETRLRAELAPAGEALTLRLVVAPLGADGPRVVPATGRRRLMAAIGAETVGTERQLDAERSHLDAVLDACTCLDPDNAHCEWLIDDVEAALGLVESLPTLPAIAAVDWPKGQPVRVHAVDSRQLSVQVGRERDWFRLSGSANVDEGLVVQLETLLAAAREKSRFVAMGDGVYVALTRALKQKLAEIAAVAETDGKGGKGGGKIPTLAAAWLDDILDGTALEAGADFRTAVDRLRAAQQLAPAVPKALQATLRPYQEDGYQWAMRLAAAGMGACLADDMGLGKTLQALAVMLARANDGPALVIAPTSVCGNWLAEINRFAPSLAARIYSEGDEAGREAMVTEAGRRDVLIVSYTLLQLASERFAGKPWHTLVADEAQAIKNATAKRSQAVFELNADFRLALSGTPVENRLSELWSIMRFANPGLLGTLTRFNERFAGPIERNRDRDAQHVLKRLIGPFVLRRLKAQVLDDLPPRTELVLAVVPEAAEAAHYEALRRQAVDEIAALGGAPAGQARFNVLAQLTRLRRAACDPRLTSPEFAAISGAGAKVQAFAELAAELAANGHKTLVFSQFVDFLQLLRVPLDAAGIAYQYLDGATPAAERSKRVAAFQQGEGDFFLISLKAGGFGLNLTAADYVVITDPWWNPAAEDQAMGRAHRIGQQRPVTVYRLVTRGSIEERIVDLHHDKRALAESILAEGDAAALPATDDLIALIRGD